MYPWTQHICAHVERLNLYQWRVIYLLAALMVACKVMSNQHGWVNNDSLLYFEQARLMADGQFQHAFKLFSWTFYPGLIALVHSVTGLDIQTSAQCLNAVFFVLFVAGFQQLLITAGASLRTLHWGQLLLFSTPYIVGDVLGMLLRDEGFWAAYSWGLVYWLRALQSQRWQDVILFQLCMAVAVLFRIESSAYLVALPLLMLAYPAMAWSQRLKLWLQSNMLVIACASLLALAVLLGILEIKQLGRLQEVFTQITRLFTERIDFINDKALIISKQVLGKYLDQYGTMSLWFSLILIATLKTLKVAGLPALLVLGLPDKRWWSALPSSVKQLVITTLITSFIVSVVIILNVFILSSRYVIASGIVMLMLAAFALSYWQTKWHHWATYGFTAILSLMLINTLWDRGYVDLDRQAVNYIQSINKMQQPVFYDTENARFYAKQPYRNRVIGQKLFKELVQEQKIGKYALYMITISQDDDDLAYEALATETLRQHHFTVLKTIYGWHHKSKSMIFSKQDMAE